MGQLENKQQDTRTKPQNIVLSLKRLSIPIQGRDSSIIFFKKDPYISTLNNKVDRLKIKGIGA